MERGCTKSYDKEALEFFFGESENAQVPGRQAVNL